MIENGLPIDIIYTDFAKAFDIIIAYYCII